MTIPVERTNAVVNTEQFLLELIDPKKTPRVPRYIRDQAHHLLRHYPTKHDMDIVAKREDGAQVLIMHKVFGEGL
jgi:hypothetical protein